MGISSKLVEHFLSDSRTTIFNAHKLEDIKTRLVNRGYTDEKLLTGQTKFEGAAETLEEWKTAYAAQVGATNAFNLAELTAYDHYSDTVALAKHALEGNFELLERLELNGPKKRGFKNWTAHAMRLYSNALDSEEALALLNEFNITGENLELGKQLVESARKKKDIRDDKRGAAQALTPNKRKAIKELKKWLLPFKTACRVEFKNEPQQLERLGITVYSDGYVSAKTRKKNEEKRKAMLTSTPETETTGKPLAKVRKR